MSHFAGFSRQNLNFGQRVSFFYLMYIPASDAILNAELQVSSEKEWAANCSYRASKSLSVLQVRTKWVGRLCSQSRRVGRQLYKIARDNNSDIVRQISARLTIGFRCVLDEAWKCKKTADQS